MSPSILQDGFKFPQTHHLVVTTKKDVLTIDNHGLRKIFTSGSGGIMAAKEAPDGSGTLAIADSLIVLLHQIEKGMNQSHRLKSAQGEIRLLKFAPDGKTLYFTTVLNNHIQSYNVAERRVLEPRLDKHASPPTIIAVSPKAHILVSISHTPPTAMLRYRQGPWEPVIPKVSRAAVSVVSFHPRKSHIFLMGFKDGSLASYDTLGVSNRNKSLKTSTAAKEIACFKSLHSEVRTDEGEACGVTGASFLPGTRLTAVTLGIDGKCRCVDFESKQITNTWAVRAPGTSLAVLLNGSSATQQKPDHKLNIEDGKSLLGPLIAVGRIDGQVRLYDTRGKLLQEYTVDEMNGAVTDLEWISGSSPESIGILTKVDIEKNQVMDISIEPMSSRCSSRAVRPHENNIKLEATSQHIDEKPAPATYITEMDIATELVDDVDELSTVRHTDIKGGGLHFPTYMDLFSPIKKEAELPPRNTSPRNRPRITSSTFVEHLPPPDPPILSPTIPRTLISLPPSHPGSARKLSNTSHNMARRIKQKMSPKKVAFKSVSRSGSMLGVPAGLLASQDHRLVMDRSSSSSSNAEILARLRALGDEPKKDARKGGSVAALAPYYDHNRRNRSRIFLSSNETTNVMGKRHKDSMRVSNRRRSRVSLVDSSTIPNIFKERRRPKAKFNVETDLWLTESESESEPPKLPSATKTTRHAQAGLISQLQVSSNETMYTARSHEFAEIPSSLYSTFSSSEGAISPRGTRYTHRHKNLKKNYPSHTVVNTSGSTISTRIFSPQSSDTADLPEPYQPALPPGYAESYAGPVEVDHYLPRRASLNFRSPESGRNVLGPIAGNEQRLGPDDTPKAHGRECVGCGALKSRVENLEQEIAELKRFLLEQIDSS